MMEQRLSLSRAVQLCLNFLALQEQFQLPVAKAMSILSCYEQEIQLPS